MKHEEIQNYFDKQGFDKLSIENEDFSIKVKSRITSTYMWSRNYSLDYCKVQFIVKSKHLKREEESALSRGQLKLSKATTKSVQAKVDKIYKNTEDAVVEAKRIANLKNNKLEIANIEMAKIFPNIGFIIKQKSVNQFVMHVNNIRFLDFHLDKNNKIHYVSLLFRTDIDVLKNIVKSKALEVAEK